LLQLIMFISILLLTLIRFNSAFGSENCTEWFQNTGVKVSDPECEMKCSTAAVDMGDFVCPQKCPDFCKGPPSSKPCSMDPYWKDKLEKVVPAFKAFNEEERI
jgi:hypothetical protein